MNIPIDKIIEILKPIIDKIKAGQKPNMWDVISVAIAIVALLRAQQNPVIGENDMASDDDIRKLISGLME